MRRELRTISGERRLVEERTGAKVREFGQMFRLNPEVADIADRYALRWEGVDLLVLGAVERAAGGCACPESVLLKALVLHLVLRRDEVVILDMEAGIEHLGRGTALGVDLMLAVVEPGRRSVETAHRVRELSAALGIRRFGVVLNKSGGAADCEWAAGEFGGGYLLGAIPADPRIARADRDGQSLSDPGYEDLLAPFRELVVDDDAQRLLERPDRLIELAIQHAPVGDDHDGVEDAPVAASCSPESWWASQAMVHALAAAGASAGSGSAARAVACGVVDEPPHGVELVVAREDQRPFPVCPRPLPRSRG